MKILKKITSGILLGTFLVGGNYGFVNAYTSNTANPSFTATSAEEESYWYSRYNLGNLVMRSGMGERYMPDKEMIMKALMMVDSDFDKAEFMKGNDNYGDGDHPRPPMNPFLIHSVYKSGNPNYITKFNPSDFATQKWDETKMDKTLTLEALSYTIQKEVEWAKDFHGEGHFGTTSSDFGSYWRFVGMMMNMNAKMQAKYFSENMDKFMPNKTIKGHFALIGAISDLAAMMNADKFEANHNNRYKDIKAGAMFLGKADMMFSNGYKMGMEPKSITEYGVAIKSLVWYIKATKNLANKKIALKKIMSYSDALVSMKGLNAGEESYRVAGLIEANRVTGVNGNSTKIASQDFLNSFDFSSNLFKGQTTYTIDQIGTIIGALNEIKLFVVNDESNVQSVFREFFRNVVNNSGILHSAPPLKIAKSPWEYKGEPENYFRNKGTPMPPMAGGDFGVAPVFATEVSFVNGAWKVTNPNFDSAGAMHASNEMIWLHNDELNGFPKLYILSNNDNKLLNNIEKKVKRLSNTNKEVLSSKIKNLYSKYGDNSRVVVILKALEKMISNRDLNASINGFGDSNINGHITFHKDGSLISINANISGLPKGSHSFHIHKGLSCGNNGKDALGHFDPNNTEKTSGKFLGNIGHIYSDGVNNSVISDIRNKGDITLTSGYNKILGKTIVIHGISGNRIACGIIR